MKQWNLSAAITLIRLLFCVLFWLQTPCGNVQFLACLSCSESCSSNVAKQTDCIWVISAFCALLFIVLLLLLSSSSSHTHYEILACVCPSGKPFLTFLPFVASTSIHLLLTYFFSRIPVPWGVPIVHLSLFSLPFLSLSFVSHLSSFHGYWFMLSMKLPPEYKQSYLHDGQSISKIHGRLLCCLP